MPVLGHDPARCAARNHRAARLGVNAAPVLLSVRPPTLKPPPPIDTSDPATEQGLRIVTARGSLPATPGAAVERINRVRGADAEPLTVDRIHVVYLEAGNSNFIRKYFMHLADSTLRNIARRASRSIAFMNSHRTGGLSTEAELPYGRTFAGRWEQAVTADDRRFSRTLLGVYMLRGQRPNGANGPSTDELYAGVEAGTIFDVSLGILGGDEVCDVCGNDLDETDDRGRPLCSHVPGTRRNMTQEQVDAQLARGVPGGVCSFTLEDATAGEVSPVFDGAVPGAGFRKALRAARSRQLSAVDLDEARRSFAPLLGRRDFRPADPDPRGPVMAKKKTVSLATLARLAEQLGVEVDDDEAAPGEAPAPASAAPTPPAAQPAAAAAVPPAPPARPASDTEDRQRALEQQLARLEQTLQDERTNRQRETLAQRRAAVLAQAENWADGQIRLQQARPAERDELVSLHAQAAMDDHDHPAAVGYRDVDNTPKTGTRVQALKALWAKRGPQDQFGREYLAPRDAPEHDAAGEPFPAGAPAPLVTLKDLPGHSSADPLTRAMVDQAREWGARMNGHATPPAK